MGCIQRENSRNVYLLDTSAFRAISNQVLENLRLQNLGLYASPYVFWEVVCHLDENEGFDRNKGRLMKFKYVEVLDDPRAEIETQLLPGDSELREHVTDGNLINAALAALQASNSLNAFYSAYIQDSRGRLRQISDCAINAQKALSEEEGKCIGFITKIIQAFSSGQVKLAKDKDHHQAVLSLMEGCICKLKRRGASEVGLRQRIINDTYIYHSYIFHQALRYFTNGKTNLSPNDYEDGRICLHLKLNTPYRFVTDDKNLRASLDKTVALINRLDEPHFKTELQVCDTTYLKSLA